MSKFQITPMADGISPEDAMAEFNTMYIPIANVADRLPDISEDQRSKIYAKVANSVDSKINKEAKELGLTLEGKLHENVETVLVALRNKIQDLTKSNEDLKTNTDAASKNEIEKLSQRITDLSSLNTNLKSDYENISNEKKTIETEFSQKQLEIIISNKLLAAKNEYTLVDDINIRDACTFDESKYKFSINEKNEDVVYDANGNAVISKMTATVGTFASYKEVLESIYAKRGAFKKLLGGGGVNPALISEKPKLENRINLGNKKLGK